MLAVTVWESDEMLQKFVESNPHAGIKAALEREMEESWFKRFDVSGEEVPLNILSDGCIQRKNIMPNARSVFSRP
ncbi:hypothetical protein [Natronococcus wangiae]|uniref:hypothetical protein n=1 Tax=Natronococcus wangiae TaxID=3068275 RepID=UPI00273E16EE|nr:hypothetical protein [Natronococcus sp. AD5]